MSVIAVIVPCYNQAKYLDECLSSIYNQIFNDWECIIVNDGSTDNPEDIVNKWLKIDNRFKYISQNNSGVSAARNNAIKATNSTYILPLDADDKIAPEYISKALIEFNNHKDLSLVYCLAKKFGEINADWDLGKFNLYDLAIDNKIFCSAIFKKQDWVIAGGYDESMLEGIEDWEFWINILKNKAKVIKLDYVGFYYRIKQESRQVSFNKTDKSKTINYIISKHPNFFFEAIKYHKLQHDKLKNSIKYCFKNLISLVLNKFKKLC